MTDYNSFLNDLRNQCNDFYNCDVIIAEYSDCDKMVTLSAIRALEPGSGQCTRALNYLIAELKKSDIEIITIIASPLGVKSTKEKDALTKKLVKWYKKFGFIVVKENKYDRILESVEMKLTI